ncbi:hypothetical protein L7F22_062434 [Adiantum nelumboides]|nr:hypothetical protein [Adiantum nelumboides]
MQGACGWGRGNAMSRIMQVLAMVMVVSLCASQAVLAATTYKVGDDAGWDIMSYDSWVAGKTFMEGDTLEFVYSGGLHDVVDVNAANYAACAKGSNVVYNDGDTKYVLAGVGTKYYICTVSNHCTRGMKLSIDVVAAATTPTSSPSPTNSTTPTTPSSPNTTTTTPPPSSSPLSVPPSIFTLFLILGLSILFFHSS